MAVGKDAKFPPSPLSPPPPNAMMRCVCKREKGGKKKKERKKEVVEISPIKKITGKPACFAVV